MANVSDDGKACAELEWPMSGPNGKLFLFVNPLILNEQKKPESKRNQRESWRETPAMSLTNKNADVDDHTVK